MSKRDLWYKRYPDRFNYATRHMSFDVRSKYGLVVDLFYWNGGPLPNDDRWIADHLRCPLRTWKTLRKALFAAAKVFIGNDGLIHNETADELIAERKARMSKKAGEDTTEATKIAPPSDTTEAPKKTPTFAGEKIQKGNKNNDRPQKHDAQKTLYARATKTEEVREERRESGDGEDHHHPIDSKKENRILSLVRKDDDDDCRNHRRIPQSLRTELANAVGAERADELIAQYLASEYAANAKMIDRAFVGWLKKTYDIGITARGATTSLGDILATLPRDQFGRLDTTLPTAEQLAKRRAS